METVRDPRDASLAQGAQLAPLCRHLSAARGAGRLRPAARLRAPAARADGAPVRRKARFDRPWRCRRALPAESAPSLPAAAPACPSAKGFSRSPRARARNRTHSESTMKRTRRFPESAREFVTHGVSSRSRNRRLGASYEADQKKRATAHSFGRPPDSAEGPPDSEPWGRGTHRVIEMCHKAGIAPPIFQGNGPFAVVTFQVRVGQTAQVTTQVGAQDEAQVGTRSKSYGSAARNGPWLN